MEQQNKYYTPDISELHVGYECEHTSNMSAFICEDYDDVVKDKLTSTDLRWYITWGEEEKGLEKFVRTKYLDQSDIESCGWVKDWDENSNYTDCYKLLVKSDINDQSDDNWELWQYGKIVSISNESSNRCFDGECKSINELKKLMQWLNIK